MKALAIGLLLALAALPAGARREEGRRGPEREGRGPEGRHGPEHQAQVEVPERAADVILGRPTATSVTASVLSYAGGRGRVEYGTREGQYTERSPMTAFSAGEPVHLKLGPLKPDTRYYYRLRLGSDDGEGVEGTFHTQRPAGEAFTFTVQADPHLDQNTSTRRYERSLLGALADQPDFHIDLGDTFMTGKYRGDEPSKLYLAQRYYFGLLCRSAPLFLALGNHDGEPGGGREREDALPLRKKFFANPAPDGFYTGERSRRAEDYYAWRWGDALFVVLDPFRYSGRPRGEDEDGWTMTLGEEQYRWLERTLAGSKAAFKFVFIHNLVGGQDREGRNRGGAEAAAFYEWGGRDADGRDGFSRERPGWGLPIHKLLARGGVSVVFHGHDHFFAKQELDGVVYQLVPQPGAREKRESRDAERYGYEKGVFLSSPGYLRVRVSPESAAVDFVRPSEEDGEGPVAYTYTVKARR